MEPLGNQFLTRAAFANDKNRPIERGGTARTLNAIKECPRLPDELIVTFHDYQLLG